ncbi:MAG: hypothetical protein LC776_03965 [Acidobacteria bacterium]|nr:hypothetical protein [Acidobacteriota bacterium]
MSILTYARRTRTTVLAACATVALSGALAATTASSATAQSLSGCFLNGKELFSFQADSGIGGTNGSDTIDCTNSPKARIVFGRNGNDTIIGSNFNDNLKGDFGNDSLHGRAGNDFLTGDSGTDRCSGGSGTDTANNCETVTGVP